MVEEKEKEKRQCNLIIYNLKEDESEDPVSKRETETAVCVNLFTEEIRIEDMEIETAYRLGQT